MTFRQSVMLLILTALLTGILVPTVKDIIDRRSHLKQQIFDAERRQEEKKYDAALVRQSKIIDSEAELLDNLATMFWRLWKMVLKVIYYRTLVKLPDRHEIAVQEYDQEGWELTANIRAEISRANRLASPQIHERLEELFERFVGEVDIELNRLRTLDTQPNQDSRGELEKQWNSFRHHIYRNVGNEIDALLTDLAQELRLAERPGKVD